MDAQALFTTEMVQKHKDNFVGFTWTWQNKIKEKKKKLGKKRTRDRERERDKERTKKKRGDFKKRRRTHFSAHRWCVEKVASGFGMFSGRKLRRNAHK